MHRSTQVLPAQPAAEPAPATATATALETHVQAETASLAGGLTAVRVDSAAVQRALREQGLERLAEL